MIRVRFLDGPVAGQVWRLNHVPGETFVVPATESSETVTYRTVMHLSAWFDGDIPAAVGEIQRIGTKVRFTDPRAIPYATERALRTMIEHSARSKYAELRVRITEQEAEPDEALEGVPAADQNPFRQSFGWVEVSSIGVKP